MTRPTYTGRGLPLAIAASILLWSALYACVADASEPDPSRPWGICIPVTTSHAAAFAAANPPTFQGTSRVPPVWIGVRSPAEIEADRSRRDARRVIGGETPDPTSPMDPVSPVAPIPLPAALWLLAGALGALALIRRKWR